MEDSLLSPAKMGHMKRHKSLFVFVIFRYNIGVRKCPVRRWYWRLQWLGHGWTAHVTNLLLIDTVRFRRELTLQKIQKMCRKKQ